MAKHENATERGKRTHPTSATRRRATTADTVRAITPVPGFSGHSGGHTASADQRESEAQFAGVFASTTVGVAVLTLAADFIQVNDAFCQTVGYSREELARLNCGSLTHPDDCPEMNAKIAALIAGEIPTFVLVKRYIRKDGMVIWVRNSVSLTRDANGKPLQLVALCNDITERKQAGDALRNAARADAFRVALGDAIRWLGDPVEIQHTAARVLGEHLGVSRAYYAEVQDDDEYALVRSDYHVNGVAGVMGQYRIDDFNLPLVQRLRAGRTVAVADIQTEPDLTERERAGYAAANCYAFITVPLIKGDHYVATLVVDQSAPRQWTAAEVALVEETAERTWANLERARAEEALRAREAELARELADMALLQEISGWLIQEGDLDDLNTGILDAAIKIMRSDAGSLQILVHERNELRLLAWKGFAPESAAFWKWVRADAGSSCAQVMNTGERVIVEDVETCDFLSGTADLDECHRSGIQAMQSTPLIARDGRLLGMISTHWCEPHAPSNRDLRLLDVLARQAADLIEQKHAEETLRFSEERQSFLLTLEDRLRGLTDPHQVKRVACELLGIHLGVWRVAYGETDPQNTTLLTRENKTMLILEDAWTDGALPTIVGRFPLSTFENWVATVPGEGRDVTIEDDETAPRIAGQRGRKLLQALGVQSGDSALIVRDGRLAGLLVVHSKTTRRWSSEEHNLLREVAERTWEAITRARAEEALRATEERYRTLFSLVPVAIYSCDASGIIREFNQRAVDLWSREPDRANSEERYCGSVRLFYPDGRPMRREESPMARALRGEAIAESEAEILVERPDGTRRSVIAHPQAWVNEHGEIIGAINCLYDITERKRFEEASAYLAAIVTSSYDAIVSKTLEGIVTSWNASAEQMFGYTADEMIGQSILRIVPPDRTGEEDYILDSIRAGRRIEYFETVRVMKDGRELDVSLTISPIRDSAGKIIGASKIARDITERKRLEDALRASERRMNEFLGIAAHELRTPLTSITANVQMARKQLSGRSRKAPDAGDDQAVARAALLLERTDRQVLRLGRLVNDLVDISRIQAGKLEMRQEPCDPLTIVRDAVGDQRAAWPQRSITLIEPREVKGAIMADADRIGQVVTNLLTNALKYSPDEAQVDVRVTAEDDSLRVEVRDKGPGLSAGQQEHLFERFYRAPNIEVVSGAGVGLGLGLHICKTIIERHGGEIGVISAPGRGSAFWFTLPLDERARFATN